VGVEVRETWTHPLPRGWVVRAATTEDVGGIVEMMNARTQAFYGENQSTPHDVELWWGRARFQLEKDLRIVADQRGRVAGLVSVDNPGQPYARIDCSAAVHPQYAGQMDLWDGLYAWGLGRTRELVPLAASGIRVTAECSAASQDGARRAALERAGFQAVRVANHMGIDLAAIIPEARWPSGVTVRTVNVEQDLRAIVALFLESWRDHWGFIARPFDQVLADWREGIESDGEQFDPTLWFLAVEGDEVVGISLCNSHIADDSTRGYVQGLGVRPAWRKRGIALALLHHTFAEFQRRGYAGVELDMDSQNLTGALRVYERAGMHVIRQSVNYEKELRPGVDLATRALAAS
jgi:mycothiol synthase